jgi:hypothetical protein
MSDEANPSNNADAGRGLSEGLGASPTDAEDRAFWAFMILGNVWAASDATGWLRWTLVLPWFALALAVRWPYWRRIWLRRGGA